MLQPYVTLVGEGTSDIAVATRVCADVGLTVSTTYPMGGKATLDLRIAGYNKAAKFSNWVVLRDLDHDAVCAPDLVSALLPRAAKRMTFRIAVRSIESWLIADSKALASFLKVRVADIPANPESLARPKRTLVDIARKSRSSEIVDEMVPDAGEGEVGPGYTLRIIEFAGGSWDPKRAAASSDSLKRCVAALRSIVP